MYKTLLVLAIVPMLAFATMSDEEGMVAIQRMENHPYGKTLLDTIALQIQNQDSADDLILMLRETEQKMFSEQQADDQAQMDLQNQCYADINKLTEEIKAAEKRVKEINAELDEKIPIRDSKIAERTDLEQFRDLLKERIRIMAGQRKIRDEAYEKQKKEHDHAASVITNAKQVLEAAFRSNFLQKVTPQAAFAQVSSHFAATRQTHYIRKSWNSIFNVMAELTNKMSAVADSDLLKQVFALMDRLLDEIAASRELERQKYEQWVQFQQKIINNLQNTIAETQASIDQLTAEINALTKRINMLKDEKADQLERIEQKTKEREERKIYCDDEAAAYAKRRQDRQDEIEVVSDAIALLTSKLRMLKRYVSDKTSSLQRPTY